MQLRRQSLAFLGVPGGPLFFGPILTGSNQRAFKLPVPKADGGRAEVIEDYFPDSVLLLLDLQNHLLPQELSRVKLSLDEAGKNAVSALFWVFSVVGWLARHGAPLTRTISGSAAMWQKQWRRLQTGSGRSAG